MGRRISIFDRNQLFNLKSNLWQFIEGFKLKQQVKSHETIFKSK